MAKSLLVNCWVGLISIGLAEVSAQGREDLGAPKPVIRETHGTGSSGALPILQSREKAVVPLTQTRQTESVDGAVHRDPTGVKPPMQERLRLRPPIIWREINHPLVAEPFGKVVKDHYGVNSVTAGNLQVHPDRAFKRSPDAQLEKSTGFASLSALQKTVAWGQLSVAQGEVTCAQALTKLGEVGRHDQEYREPRYRVDRYAELDYANACLNPLTGADSRVQPELAGFSHRVGRLIDENGDVVCTVFYLDKLTALTARHCWFRTASMTSDPKHSLLAWRTSNPDHWTVETLTGVGA
jgi:hypothetical protein